MSPASQQTPAVAIDLVALNRTAQVPDALGPDDLRVTVDGRPRKVLWVRRVSRGPGSLADAAARKARGTAAVVYAAEPSRTAFIVVDEASFAPGGERQAIQGAAAFLDRLGITDRVSVARVPLRSNQIAAPTNDRPPAREAINRIAGRMTPQAIPVDGVTPDARHVSGDPMGAQANRSERPERQEQAESQEEATASAPAGSRDGLDGLIRILAASERLPGRKIVAFYSAGIADDSSARLTEVTRTAASARASLYIFGLPRPSGSRAMPFDARVLERLARSTGGVFVSVSRKPESDVDRLAPELSGCFQIGVERMPADDARAVLELRVESSRADLVVRAASMVASRIAPDGDVEAPGPSAGSGAPEAAAPPAEHLGGRPSTVPPPAVATTRDGELDIVVGTLADYVRGYVGQYSALVAEEEYRQSLPNHGQNRRLRSDLLFVRAENSQEWVSFRDVFEVDGAPVRDRDDRLKALFLNPTPGTAARLRAIKDESARYNIGSFDRNINVPLFALKFLSAANRNRFEFRLAGESETAGVRTWRLEYVERARPTVVTNREGGDVPVEGRFIVERATGAIVESAMTVEQRDYAASIVVKYTRDARLGMWVPAEMKETFRVPWVGRLDGRTDVVVEGTARYTNFRRFQVSTEEKVVIPK